MTEYDIKRCRLCKPTEIAGYRVKDQSSQRVYPDDDRGCCSYEECYQWTEDQKMPESITVEFINGEGQHFQITIDDPEVGKFLRQGVTKGLSLSSIKFAGDALEPNDTCYTGGTQSTEE